MDEEKKRQIKSDIHDIIQTLGAKVVEDDEFQKSIKGGAPVICARYDANSKAVNMELWDNEALRPSLTGDCALCHNRIMYSPQVKDATFRICIQCLVLHKDELEKEFGKEGEDETMA